MFNNNLKRNHAKHEKCNTAIKQIMQHCLGAVGGAPTNHRRPRAALRPSKVGAHEFWPAQLSFYTFIVGQSHRHKNHG